MRWCASKASFFGVPPERSEGGPVFGFDRPKGGHNRNRREKRPMKDFRGRTVISGILVWHWVSEFCDSLEDPALPCATLRSARSARRPGPTHNNQKGPTPSAPLVHTRPGRTSRLLPGLLSVFCPYSVRIGCHASASPGGLVRILSVFCPDRLKAGPGLPAGVWWWGYYGVWRNQ